MEHFLREASAWLDPEEGEILLQACFVPKIGQNRQTAAIVLTSAMDRPAKLLIQELWVGRTAVRPTHNSE